MQNEYELKKLMCDIGKRIYDRNMVAANDGNISVKLNDNEFLCTPTGVSKGFMTPDFICKVDAQGNVIQANKASVLLPKLKMHMRVYQKRPDVGAWYMPILHLQPPSLLQVSRLHSLSCRKRLSLWDVFRLLSTAPLPQRKFPTTWKNTFLTMMRFCWKAMAPLHGAPI